MAIADAEARIEDLTTKVEEMTALSAQLNTEIKNYEQEVAKNQNALEQATAMRQKELAEFNAAEKDMLGTIQALKQALTVLKKHNSASALLQVQNSNGFMNQMQVVASKINHIMQHHDAALKHTLTHSKRQVVTAFIESSFKQSAPQSG